MDENSIVKIKDDYVFFQDEEFVCLYQKSTKLIILKVKAGIDAYNENTKNDLSRPHQIRWLSKQGYWKWLGIVVLKYPMFFDVLDEDEAALCVKDVDYFSVVNRTHFAESFQVDSSFENMRIFLWGSSALNKMLYDAIKTKTSELYLVKNPWDENDENSFWTLDKERQWEEACDDKKIISQSDLEKMDLKKMDLKKDDLFLIDATGVSEENLFHINDLLVKKGCMVLLYGNRTKEVTIGPLVIGGESACLKCMKEQGVLKQYYNGENSFLDEVHAHLFLFFVLRILYYIKGKNLYYLLSDVQIPINKIFTISKEDMTAKMHYLYRKVGCICCK